MIEVHSTLPVLRYLELMEVKIAEIAYTSLLISSDLLK